MVYIQSFMIPMMLVYAVVTDIITFLYKVCRKIYDKNYKIESNLHKVMSYPM